jgi:hypothetical protein
MGGQAVAQLAGLAAPYRGRDFSEQEYKPAMVHVRIRELSKWLILSQETISCAFGRTKQKDSAAIADGLSRGCQKYIRCDRLYGSISVMYVKDSNVIPFPDRGDFDLLGGLESIAEGAEDLRRQLDQFHTMSRSDRIAGVGGLWLSMAAIRRGLQGFDMNNLPGRSTPPVWHKKLMLARKRLDWQMSRVAYSLKQGHATEQISSMLVTTLDEIEAIVADQYPIQIGD